MKTLRKQLKDLDGVYDADPNIAIGWLSRQVLEMDALLEDCAFSLAKCMNLDLHEEGEIGHKLREAGYGV